MLYAITENELIELKQQNEDKMYEFMLVSFCYLVGLDTFAFLSNHFSYVNRTERDYYRYGYKNYHFTIFETA